MAFVHLTRKSNQCFCGLLKKCVGIGEGEIGFGQEWPLLELVATDGEM
jgi:hypothetical protein